MTTKPKKMKKTKPEDPKTCIDKLRDRAKIEVLNDPMTACKFWRSIDEECDISGIKPVKRTTIETINANGFTPFDKKIEEDLFLYFNIELVDSKDPYIMSKEDIEKKNKIGKNGKIYLKHNDSFYIYEFIRNKA
jgi:hypothetical protein